MILPTEAAPLLAALAPAFTTPTFARVVTLLVAALLTTGPRTVANLLRTLGPLTPGHRTDYQRVLSRAPWSGFCFEVFSQQRHGLRGCGGQLDQSPKRLGRVVADQVVPERFELIIGNGNFR